MRRTIAAPRVNAAKSSILNLRTVASANLKITAVNLLSVKGLEKVLLFGDGDDGLKVLVEEGLGDASGGIVSIGAWDLRELVVTGAIEVGEGMTEGLEMRECDAMRDLANFVGDLGDLEGGLFEGFVRGSAGEGSGSQGGEDENEARHCKGPFFES
jgi:hypothetical protein